MLFMFNGDIATKDAGGQLQVLWSLLRAEGVTRLNQLQVSVLGWGENGRYQIVADDHRTITAMSFESSETSEGRIRYVRVPGASIRQRPHDLEFNPLAIMFGHDD